MITEDFVSYEVAKLLEKKGFEIQTVKVYDNQNKLDYQNVVCWQKKRIPYINAPTHQMAMSWLREVHNIFIIVEPYSNTSCYFSLWQGDNYYANPLKKNFPSYRGTVEAALKYVLENLI